MKMGGFMDEITYEGEFEPIKLGEYMHVRQGERVWVGEV
jgi:hypothetical protein